MESCPQYNPNTAGQESLYYRPFICRNSIPGGSDGSGSFAAYENQALEKISLTALAVRPQNIRPTPDIGFFRLDQLNKKIYNLSVTFKGKQTDTAQEQARDHDQSIR